MPARALAGAVFVAALFLCGRGATFAGSSYSIGLIGHDGVRLHAEPMLQSPTLAVLVEQTQVEILARQAGWDHVRIWASIVGWVLASEVDGSRPWESTSHYHAPRIVYPVHAHAPQRLQVEAITTVPVALAFRPGSTSTDRLPLGANVRIDAWEQDTAGRIWYRISGISAHGGLWGEGSAFRFLTPDPGRSRVHGRYVWEPITGKGMWLTLGTIADTSAEVLVRAALHNGITHLYLESAISPLGFHGRQLVGRLIDAAHRRRLIVIAWVYPYLYDIASDVALTTQVASYSSAAGQRFDGIAADLEQNVRSERIRAYSQLIRAYLGPTYLLVGVTYSPQSFSTYPFAEVAYQYNLVAPMDYWHETKTSTGLDYGHQAYGSPYGYRYAQDSIHRIRHVVGDVPIAPIGQMFDDFGRLEMGPHAPSAGEITGFLHGCKTEGAVGVSFFQWMTATDDEWRAFQEFIY